LDVKIVLTTPEAYLFALRSVDLADYTVIELPATPLDGPSRFLKRALDVTVSAGLLLLLSPLLALIAWLIRLHDGGPALVAQEHIGADEVPFRLLKFRTTEPGLRPSVPLSAAGAETPPPASSLAAFLRARRLDKLPELFNVLVGDMSLVGPRPPLPEEVSMYASWHRCRFAEKPGLTGLWQVEKFRKWRFDQMVRLDLYYVLNRSLALDLQILLRTIATVFAP
jgi:lipopolysaccharide/colanic/teichoic acid biosynthesis glycosyltransferase